MNENAVVVVVSVIYAAAIANSSTYVCVRSIAVVFTHGVKRALIL